MTIVTNDFLAHFGVKGMHWGVRKDDTHSRGPAPSAATIAQRKAAAKPYYEKATVSRQSIAEMDKLGIHSKPLRQMYGDALDKSNVAFWAMTGGTTKEGALKNLRAQEERNANRSEKIAQAKEQGKLTPDQKLGLGLAIGGAALGVGAAFVFRRNLTTAFAKAGNPIAVENFLAKYNRRATIFQSKTITKEAFDAMDTQKITVPKGRTLKRLTAYPDESLDQRLYVTVTKADADRYAGVFGPGVRERSGLADIHISSLDTNTDLVSPSQKHRVQTLIDLIQESPDNRYALKSMHAKNMIGTTNILDTDTAEQAALKAYGSFSSQMHTQSSLHTAYFEKLQSQGYNMLVDDNNAGQLSDLPMILLDSKNTIASRTSEVLTPEMEKAAQQRLIELLDPVKK